jgi:hypothetical protein
MALSLEEGKDLAHGPSRGLPCATPERIVAALLVFVPLFALLNLAGPFSSEVLGRGRLLGLVPLSRSYFALHVETTVPTWYSSSILLACSAVAALIARGESIRAHRGQHRWLLVAGIFLFMSVDETAMIHESFDEVARYILGGEVSTPSWLRPAGSGAPSLPWFAVGLPLIAFVVLWLSPWILRLPRRTLLLFVASGLMFVGGAVGVEMITWRFFSDLDPDGLTRAALITVEECLEMLGVLAALYTMLDYCRSRSIPLAIQLDPSA